MKEMQQLSWYLVELVLYGLAAALAFLAVGLGLTIVGLPLVPPVLAAALALVWLARHIGHGGRGVGAAGPG